MPEQYFHEKDSSVKTAFGNLQNIVPKKVEGDSHAGSGKISIATGVTDKQVVANFPSPAAGLKSLVLVSTVDLTVEFNSSGSPTATIALKAGVKYDWDTNSYDTCKQTVATTSIYISNASGQTGEFLYDAVFDGTP